VWYSVPLACETLCYAKPQEITMCGKM
jgi:hypothetical protein